MILINTRRANMDNQKIDVGIIGNKWNGALCIPFHRKFSAIIRNGPLTP